MEKSQTQIQERKYSKLAVASFVSGITAIVLILFALLVVLFSVSVQITNYVILEIILMVILLLFTTPVILGVLALNHVKTSDLKGRGFAIAGIIIGAIPAITFTIMLIFTIVSS